MGTFVTLLRLHPRPFHHLLCILLLLPVITASFIRPIAGPNYVPSVVTLNITNRCSYTVWPAALSMGGGMRLDPEKTWTLIVPNNTEGGRVWAHTGCSFDGNGSGLCETGDCHGKLVSHPTRMLISHSTSMTATLSSASASMTASM